jgi:chromatin remodeling complex protein RSC6
MTKLKLYKKKIEKLTKDKDKEKEKEKEKDKPKAKPKSKSKTTEDNMEGDNIEMENGEEEVKKTRKSKKPKPVLEPPSGITKPCRISDELAQFLDKPSGTEMTRADVTKELYKYINLNGLQNQSEKVKININQALANLLSIEINQEVTYFNIQSLMNKHYIH